MIKQFALGSAIIVLLTAASVATGALLELDADLDLLQRDPLKVPPGVLEGVDSDQPRTILVLGSDRRYGDKRAGIPPRSDSMLVIRLDPRRKAMAVMSIPRDLMVTIPGHGRGRINTAYGTGGPTLSARAVKAMGIRVHHILNINFSGFQRGVNRLGCVYADVDRRYFNDNKPPVASNERYATIDLKPGYQRMCGKDSLDYVRFRHLDDDFVRAARQQDFVRQLKAQVGIGQLWGDRRELLKIFGRYTQTDIARGSNARVLGFIKLVVEAAKSPITEVRFPAGETLSDGSQRVSSADLRRTIRRFEGVRGKRRDGDSASRKRPKRIKRRKGGLAPGLVAAEREGEDHVLNIATKLRGMDVYFPKARVSRGRYGRDSPRAYTIRDRSGTPHRAYRIVFSQGENGQYYGVQGVAWSQPPILKNPTDRVRMRRRTYQRYFDGKRIRLIAWKGPKAWYWVSNTLSQQLSNVQMMDIARSLQRIGE